MKHILALALLTHLFWLSAHAQQPPVRTMTAGVLIDVSVVDNKGNPILDLTPADFEVSEDGKRQQLVSVALVNGGIAKPIASVSTSVATDVGATDRRPAPLPPLTGPAPTVTAILFDKLSPDAAPYATKAALAYVATLVPPHDHAGVFLADLNLKVFQPFTNNQEQLRAAVEQFGAAARTNVRPETQRAGDVFIQKLEPNTPPTVGAEERGGFASVAERQEMLDAMEKNDKPRYFMTMMVLRMESGYQQFMTELEGMSSAAGLRAVVDGLSLLPGRKSILYFTESLPVPDRIKPKFDAIIGEANRANITFYPVDAAGLRLHSKEVEVARNVNLSGAEAIDDRRRNDGAWTKDLERQEQLMISRPTASLGRLAKETGGFLIENTNDLGAGVARMQQERTTYYLLGYQPTNATMDGKFRRVSVKVKRSKVSVKARPGYLAVPTRQ
jgi:VWFA-related protein